MKTLDVQARLEYARAAVSVLRALKISDRTMRYGELAKAIGLIADNEKWEVWHRQQIGDILCLIAAAQRQSGEHADFEPVQFERIITSEGEPGAGFYRTARIVREPISN